MREPSGFWRNEHGATAAEFGLVLIVFLALVFGIIGLSDTIWANSTLQVATEAAARCASVTPTVCKDNGTINSYGNSHYLGPNITPSFSLNASASCGNQVSASATIPLDAVVVDLSVPLTATACFPKLS
jgi:Flp pilus assembly pilin Flp